MSEKKSQSKGKAKKYVCPFCFREIDLGRLHYACSDPLCTSKFLNMPGGRQYRSKYHPSEEIDLERNRYLHKDRNATDAVTTKHHIIRSSPDGRCEICGRKSKVRLCPECHNPISDTAEENGSLIFVVLGADGSGKSHYIATLLETLMTSFSAEFGTDFEPATVLTRDRYEDVYHRPLYVENKAIDPTQSYEVDRWGHESLVYYLSFPDRDGDRKYTVAFFDTSGYDMDAAREKIDPDLLAAIRHASGILLLIDPLQMDPVAVALNEKADEEDAADTLTYITELLKGRPLRSREKLNIPLAVAVAKADMIMREPREDEDKEVFLGPESSVRVRRLKGRADPLCLAEAGAEVEEYMRRNASQRFIDAVNGFAKHEYFAVSALGSAPAENGTVKEIKPFRVEDPFIWLFTACGGRI
ncbi:MAG: GTPase domain-containing protein [Methanomethylophilus sp.]|jgi:hypothetical protein